MNQHKNIYWIGGSPCSGKSTIAEKLVKEFGFNYYKCDDHLGRYTTLGVSMGKPTMKKISNLNIDETWLRNVDEQVNDELKFYEEAFDIIIDDLNQINPSDGIVVEGAALLPQNVKLINTHKNNYICILPTPNFQIEKYRDREWVSHYLSECTDAEKAFSNWMERDIKFAESVKQKAMELNYNILTTDGETPIEQMYKIVKNHFKLV